LLFVFRVGFFFVEPGWAAAFYFFALGVGLSAAFFLWLWLLRGGSWFILLRFRL
jgi:hypothetical protein